MESIVMPAVGNMVTNVIQNSVSGFVEAGSRTIGGYAGDFIIRGGNIIENAGRGVGNNIALRGEAWGQSIKGYSGPQSKVRPMPIRSKSTSFLTPSSSIIPRNSVSSLTPKKGLPPAPKKPTTTGTTASTTQTRAAASTAPIRARTAVKSAASGPKPVAASKPPASAATASKANVPIVATTAINPAAKRATASSAPLKKVVPQTQSLPGAAKKTAAAAAASKNKPAPSYAHIPIGGPSKPAPSTAGGAKTGSTNTKAIGSGGGGATGGAKKKDDTLAPKKYDFF